MTKIFGNQNGASAFIYILSAGIVVWGLMNSYLRQADLTQTERIYKKRSFISASIKKLVDDIINNSSICTPNFKYRRLGDQIESLRLGHALTPDQIIHIGEKFPGTNVIFTGASIDSSLANFNPATGVATISVSVQFKEDLTANQVINNKTLSATYNFNVYMCTTHEYMMIGKDWNIFDATEIFRQTCPNELGVGWEVDEDTVVEVQKDQWMASCRNLSFCGPNQRIERCY